MALWPESEYVAFGTDYGRRNGWFRRAWLRSQEKERAHRSGETVVDPNAGEWLGTPSGDNSQPEEMPVISQDIIL